MEIVLLLLGAVLGVAADRAVTALQSRLMGVIRRSRRRKRQRSADGRAATKWLLNYYDSTELYECTLSGKSKHIPFVVDAGWIWEVELSAVDDRIAIVESGEASSFLIDRKLIALRELHGQRLFNNQTFYTHALKNPMGEAGIEISQAEYYSVVTNLIALEEETFGAVQTGERSVPLRDGYLPNGSAAKELRLRPLSFGVDVGFVLRSGEDLRVLLQLRSNKTVTYGNSRAVFPCFGLEPIKSTETLGSGDVIYYNFVKEYLEEFFDYEELVDKLSQRRADPLWFMHLPEAVGLESARREGNLKIVVFGFGMDLLSGTTSLSVLVELSDEGLQQEIIANAIGNWEVAQVTDTEDPLELLDVFSPRLASYLEKDSLHYGSAFTMERIQQYYLDLRGTPPNWSEVSTEERPHARQDARQDALRH